MTTSLQNKNILLGVTGGIAAFKSADLTHKLRHSGANVKVVLTSSAQKFITPLTFQALSNNLVYTELFDEQTSQSAMDHIDLAKWADLILIAPATANSIAKLAHGLADDLLTSLCLATNKPILLAPAMNQQMWKNSITQSNLSLLKAHNFQVLGPAEGIQACGDIGPGRMLEPDSILEYLNSFFSSQNLAKNKKILITAGPTREQIDPVRFISNNSSGKMAYALAQAAKNAGASVTVITGPTHLPRPGNIHFIDVHTAQEMYTATLNIAQEFDIFIAAAAVADYRPKSPQNQKIKKTSSELTLELEKTDDILAAVAQLPGSPLTLGFAAETENLLQNATQKLLSKNLDAIIANPVGPNQGFDQDSNQATILFKDNTSKSWVHQSKSKLAVEIINTIFQKFNI
ncbi:MAG: bifunctional phosphopantothenoylcysteine decarboxylase/phosphopantothenate--cysteine ligase CoaBC [Verrucomicrobia bacterium]|nr:MAG: bifunctional phosphopantothenoylcysteine decarboxylase/phosphopantothenate--cysteine ligase CoaBC [Verrucomicrobiota bacterium]